MRRRDQFDMRAYGLFNKVRNGDPDDEIEDEIGDALRAAYTAGLRRAQELANGLAFKTAGGALRIAPSALNQAIDAEAAKEGE